MEWVTLESLPNEVIERVCGFLNGEEFLCLQLVSSKLKQASGLIFSSSLNDITIGCFTNNLEFRFSSVNKKTVS